MLAPESNPAGPKILDAGLAIVTVGMAWWYKAYAKDQTPEERWKYEFAELEAKANRSRFVGRCGASAALGVAKMCQSIEAYGLMKSKNE